MKLWKLALCGAVLAALLSPFAGAQILRPLDPAKLADIDMKSVKPGDAQFKTLSQPTRDLPDSSLSKGTLKFQNVDSKGVQLESVQYSTVSTRVLPKANFTAKHIADKWSGETGKKLDHAKRKASINEREIRTSTPAGEEELRKQLLKPH
jgi:hypothetical protein